MPKDEPETDIEAEANMFACELLMPYEQLKADLHGVDFTDDRALGKVAAKYGVPLATMAMHVGLLRMVGDL